jgi:hypothetical protein
VSFRSSQVAESYEVGTHGSRGSVEYSIANFQGWPMVVAWNCAADAFIQSYKAMTRPVSKMLLVADF